MKSTLFVLLAGLVFSSPIALAQDSSASESASLYSKIFGLFVGQSPEAVEEYLRNELGIPAENYKSYMMSGAEPDAAQAVIEVPSTTISIPFDSKTEVQEVKIDSLEIYFTYKIPLDEPPELGAYYFAIRYIDKPEIEEHMLAYAMDAYGEPVIANDEGIQWCGYVSDDGDSCVSSCEPWDADQCPPNPAVGIGEYTEGVRSIGLADWAAAPNYKGAIK